MPSKETLSSIGAWMSDSIPYLQQQFGFSDYEALWISISVWLHYEFGPLVDIVSNLAKSFGG